MEKSTDLEAEFTARIPSASPEDPSQDVAASDIRWETSIRDGERQGPNLGNIAIVSFRIDASVVGLT